MTRFRPYKEDPPPQLVAQCTCRAGQRDPNCAIVDLLTDDSKII